MPLYMHYNAALEKHFVVVYWDQCGAGKSYHKSIPTQSMNLQQFISDTHELVSLLKNGFNKQKLFLMGHSWGSLLGMHVIKNYPDDFYAFISVGQYVHGIDNERLSYEFVWKAAREKNDTAALQTLQRIGSPVKGIYQGGLQALIQQRSLLEKFGGVLHKDIRGQNSSIYRKSEEYHILDLLAARKGLAFSFPMAKAVLPSTNLFLEIPQVQLPVYFCVGRFDYNTPSELTQQYVAQLKAPKKELIWYEHSAHSLCFEQAQEFNTLCIKLKAMYTKSVQTH